MNEGSRARPIARAWKTLLRRVDAWTRRKTGVRCPLCERRARRFDPHPATGRKDARCRRCGALERHRFVWEFLRRRTSLCGGGGGGGGARVRMLHLAPEPSLGAKLRAIAGLSRVTLDIGMPGVDVRGDAVRLPFPESTFDCVYASHVFEHVVDDAAAMRECARVLKPSGAALFLVPCRLAPTDEDPSVTDAAECTRRFGQHDHFRIYGPDIVDRLRGAGFDVRVVTGRDVVGAAARELGIAGEMTGPLFVCRTRGA